MKHLAILLFLLSGFLQAQQESDFYALEKINIPKEIKLEIGGMDFLPDGRLAVCTRTGEVWLIDDLNGEPSYVRFARGLHEPLGLTAADNSLYVAQRGEVTKLSDTNGDDKADRFETIYELPLTGNYHEYHYGPFIHPDGSAYTTLNVGWEGAGVSRSKWRGWMMKQNSPGEAFMPFAAGLRSPAGFGFNAEGDVFVAENQGDWIASGRITHLTEGDFAGHRESLNWTGEPDSPLDLSAEKITNEYGTMYAAKQEIEALKLPAVWFPHGILGISTAAILNERTGGAFGPFADQLLVSDQGQSKIMRVALEKVGGEYQGAVFPFREGFSSGLLRMEFNTDNMLYAGQTARGWAATGGQEFALERLRWTGKVPFEMHHISARSDGFDIAFTVPVMASSVRAQNFKIENFTYKYHQTYGSPAIDFGDNKVTKAELLPDGKTVRLTLAGMRPGYIYEVKLKGLRGTDGQQLLHDFGYYTLNAIPGGAAGAVVGTIEQREDAGSTKRITQIPASWNDEVDADLLIESELGMKFKQKTLRVKAGQRVRLTFRNPDDMQHNFVLTAGKKGDAVGKAADGLGLRGLGQNYVPDTDDVLAHTRLVEPETDDVIYFIAPEKPGIYQYVCTVPGHWAVMRGALLVE